MSIGRNRWVVWTGCVLALTLITTDLPAQTDGPRNRSCDHFMENYVRSSARKLARALSGQGYPLQTLTLNESFAAKLSAGEVTFEVFFEKEKRAAGIADQNRKHRRTYTIVGTDQGPVITSHIWPSRDAISRGAECRPENSRIEAPAVSVRHVDVKPFKFWGLRVTWHLPETFPDSLRKDPLDALLGVLGPSDEAGTSTTQTDTSSLAEPDETGGDPTDPTSGSSGASGEGSAPDPDEDEARAESESE